METDAIEKPATKPDDGNGAAVVSTGGFGLFVRWRHQIEAEADARYWLVFRRIGIVVKRALDGTPWTYKGRRYFARIADHSLRVALGKWVVAFSLRRPNTLADTGPRQ